MKQFVNLMIVAGLSLLVPVAFASNKEVSTYALDVEFTPDKSSMKAKASIGFTQGRSKGSKVFYLHGELNVDSITLDGKEIEFKTEAILYNSSYSLLAKKVSFEINDDIQNAELKVAYQGHFHPSSARSPSDYMRIDSDGVFLRSYGYSLWFPVFLEDGGDVYKADFTNVRFKIPKNYKLVFIGEKTAEEITANHAISSWSAEDVELRNLQVTAQEYEVLNFDNINIYHLDTDKSRVAAKAIADFSSQLLEFFSSNYKPISNLQSLNLLEMPRYGDISSHNMVGISSETFLGFDTAVYAKRTIAHELVHPFVSVQTSRSDALYSLSIEGFPSYFHLPALRDIYGEQFYDDFLLRVQSYYLENKGLEQDRWGNTRPPEVPLMRISADEIGKYKDDYILWGRSKLFFNYLLKELGNAGFSGFAKDLFKHEELTETQFVELCRKYLPGKNDQINTWLYTNDFPDEFKLEEAAK